MTFSGSGHGHSGGTDGKLISVNRGFTFFIPSAATVANDLSWNPTSPQAVTAIKIWGYARTAPTGSSLIVQVYNVTQSHVVATLTFTASTQTVSSTSMTNAAIAAGDVLRLDATTIGSTVSGSNISIVLEATQP